VSEKTKWEERRLLVSGENMAKKLSYDDIPPSAIIICPKCKTENVTADQYCRDCREDLRSAKLDFLIKLSKTPNGERQKEIECSFCGARNPHRAISCHNCANSFKKSLWTHKRTIEDLRERYLESVIVSLVLSGAFFTLGLWDDNYTEMTFGLGFIALAVILFLRRHWEYIPRGNDNAEVSRSTAESTSRSRPVSLGIERTAVHMRRKSMITVRVGIALVLVGLGVLVGDLLVEDSAHSTTGVIPGGCYIAFRTNSQEVLGHLSGSYSVSPGGVDFRIYTSDQFQSYSTTGFADSVYQSNGPSGSFSVDLPGIGTYYMVAVHSDDSTLQSTTQNLSLTYSLSGIGLGDLIYGIGVVVIGAALIVMGRRIRDKVRKSSSARTNEPASCES
jgi:ribosomal protein L40E